MIVASALLLLRPSDQVLHAWSAREIRRAAHANGQPCCSHGCIQAFMETVRCEMVKKEKRREPAMTHFQCTAACWENLVEESRDR